MRNQKTGKIDWEVVFITLAVSFLAFVLALKFVHSAV